MSTLGRRSLLVASLFALAPFAFAQDKPGQDKNKPETKKPADDKQAGDHKGMPSQAEMDAMMKAGQPGPEHKMLTDNMVGDWDYTIKMWMDPSAEPQTSKGKATRKSIFGGRYITSEVAGDMMMPDASGKMTTMKFEGKEICGYDNMEKKYVSSWVDNMGTGIMNSTGTYDAAGKTFTFNSRMKDCMTGKDTNVKFTVKVTDKDHHLMEWWDDHEGKMAKTMEIAYTRSGAAAGPATTARQ